MTKPKILLVSTGGTITMTTETSAGVEPTLTGEDLVRAVPALADHCDLEVTSYSRKPGASLTFMDMKNISGLIGKAFAAGCRGAIVVQGTDTIEETAFAYDLLVDSDCPVIVTGAMRNPTMPGADGPANLLASAIVAGSPAARGRGAMVVLNDAVNSARFVRKTDTGSPAAFQSPGVGPLGRVDEGEVLFYAPPRRTRPVAVPAAFDKPVAIVKFALDDDGRLIRKVPELGYAGVVVEAMGVGHVPMWGAEIIGELVSKIPVALSTRVPIGPVFRKTYGFPGSEMDCLKRGAMPCGSLSGIKCRILLSFLLAAGHTGEELRNEFSARV